MQRSALFVLAVVVLGITSWGAGGCGGGSSGGGGSSSDGALTGDWDLLENGCDGIVTFSNAITFTLSGHATNGGKEAEIYDLSGDGVTAGEKALLYTDTNDVGYCLDPAGTILESECNLLCGGALSGDQFSGNCQFATTGDVCGPVTYKKH